MRLVPFNFISGRWLKARRLCGVVLGDFWVNFGHQGVLNKANDDSNLLKVVIKDDTLPALPISYGGKRY